MRTIAIGLGLALGVALTTAVATPAAADGWRGRGHGWGHHHRHHGHYGHRHHHHGGGSVFFSFRAAPRYYDPYYPSYRERRVVVIERPVVVERPVIVQAPPGLDLGREVADGSGRYCREYQTTGRIAGKLEQLWGVACLRPDGSWDLAG